MATKYKAPSTEYNWEQIMNSLIWLTYCLSYPDVYVGSKEYLKQLASESIQQVFANARVRRLIGTWELVWGVGIFQFPTSEINDNTVFIAKYNDNNPEKDTYAICITGTNMKSLYSLIFQDSDLFTTKDWNNGKPWKSPANPKATTEPALSAGFTRGVNVIFNKAKDIDGTVILDGLNKITSSSTKPIDLFVIGHSLAGALAPITALSLQERPEEWDPKGLATIKVVSLAGPTPGNLAFQDYYASKLGGDKTQYLWSSLDIVPYFATREGLENAGRIYEPEIPSTPLVDLLCSDWNYLVEHHNYKKVTTQPAYPAQLDNQLRAKNINKYPEVKQLLVEDLSGILVYLFMKSLEKIEDIPWIGDIISVFDDQLEDTIRLGTSIVSKYLVEIFEAGVTVDLLEERIDSMFEHVLDEISPLPLSWTPFGLVKSALPSGLIDAEGIYNFIDWYMQFYFQHKGEYIQHYRIEEFFDIRTKITSEVNATLGKEENKKQEANTILVDYGKADKDDIKELYRGEGKLLENISDVVAELKQSGEVQRNAQPLVLIVEKKD